MDESTNREKVLKKVRSALISKTPNPFPNLDMDSPVFHQTALPLELQFAEKFTESNGQFVLCNGRIELMENILMVCDSNDYTDVVCIDRNLSAFFDEFEFPHQSVFEPESDTDLQVVALPCECVIAQQGTIVFSKNMTGDMRLLSSARNLMVIAHAHQIVPDLKEALDFVKAQNENKLPEDMIVIDGNRKKNTSSEITDMNRITVILIQPFDENI